MEKIDLFETAIRYISIKPLKYDKFDFEVAQQVIKQEKRASVTFLADHGYFEKSLQAMIDKVTLTNTKNGSIYISIKGQGCSERVKRKLFEISESANSVVVFGDKENWPQVAENIKFSSNQDIFEDNHQRFFIYHSSGFNIALVARHHMHDGVETTEALITNDPQTVALLGVTVGTKAYPLS